MVKDENLVFPRTHVSPAQALSENWNNSKCIESKYMASSDVIPLILVCLYVKLNVSICETFRVMLHIKNIEKVDNSKSIDARVMYLQHDVSPFNNLSMDEISLQ